MNQDDLDRALSESREIPVTGGFTASMMVRVREEADAPPALVFPWKRVAPGLTACVVLAVVTAVVGFNADPSQWVAPAWFDRGLVAMRSVALQWTAVSLLISLASFRWSMRLAGYRP